VSTVHGTQYTVHITQYTVHSTACDLFISKRINQSQSKTVSQADSLLHREGA